MRNYEQNKPSYFATPPVQLILALHTSLLQLLSPSIDLDTRFHRHVLASQRVKATLESWGLNLVVNGVDAAHTLTAVYYPAGIDSTLLGLVIMISTFSYVRLVREESCLLADCIQCTQKNTFVLGM